MASRRRPCDASTGRDGARPVARCRSRRRRYHRVTRSAAAKEESGMDQPSRRTVRTLDRYVPCRPAPSAGCSAAIARSGPRRTGAGQSSTREQRDRVQRQWSTGRSLPPAGRWWATVFVLQEILSKQRCLAAGQLTSTQHYQQHHL